VPLVVTDAVVAGPPERAYALAKDMESYPRFMKDVVYLKVLSREQDAQLSEWHARLQGKILRWKERDVFDDAAHTIRYAQTEGDLKRFEGAWTFEPTPEGGTRITLSCDFDLGIPMLSALLDPVARLVVKRNCEDMLAAIAAQVGAAAP
jgi:ribosome-associated toxin RatA of RatAB toxin-antitoxin module